MFGTQHTHRLLTYEGAVMDQQHGVRDERMPTRSPSRLSDSEADKIRALLRLPPLLFYGELEDQAVSAS